LNDKAGADFHFRYRRLPLPDERSGGIVMGDVSGCGMAISVWVQIVNTLDGWGNCSENSRSFSDPIATGLT
jgi:hypothetical protein